jgi:hypothetical protein
MINTYQSTVTLTEDGKLTLENLPFQAENNQLETFIDNEKPLRGSILYYEDPFEPAVPEEDWEALK